MHKRYQKKRKPIHNSFKKIKFLGIKLIKGGEDLYNENFKVLKNEGEEATTRNEKTFHAQW